MPQTRLEVQQTQKMSQNIQTVIHMLSMDLDGLSEYMHKAVQENPALESVPPKKSAQDYAVLVKAGYRGGRGEYGDVAVQANAMEELEQQLRFSALDEKTRRVAIRMLHMLSPRGYLEQALDVFAQEALVSEQIAQKALEAVQALEPAGIGARTVEECLTLQLRARQNVDPLCYEIINRHLADVGAGRFRQISQKIGAPMQRVLACVDVIRGLTPSPCSLGEEAVQYIMPEFSVEADGDGQLSIIFHNDYYPSFRRDTDFEQLTAGLQGEALTFARKMQATAAQLIRAVDLRQSTMEKVARIIAREQRAFFLGQYSLVPLRIEDAAREIGVHDTTIYRALQGKYLYCARGMFPLGHFFQKEVSAGVSTARVKEMIQEICRESGKMSDQAIADTLKQRGVSISRRTIAKYRAQMNIDSSFRRSAEEKE